MNDFLRHLRYRDWHLVKRSIRFWWQRRTRGWDDSECWCLSYHIAKFTLPRLKRWKELGQCGYPSDLTPEKWEKYIDDMIYTMQSTLDYDDMTGEWENIDWKRVNKGYKLFGKYFRDLWD